MSLLGKVAVVTGATRGCGRAIAVELGRAGATVYVTGRSTRETTSPMKRPETIEETAELVEVAGGKAVPVRCDFTSVSDVDALKARIESEVDGVDILVDDVWGGDMYFHFDAPFWETPLEDALSLTHNALDTHLIALHKLLPLVVARRGLVLEVTDGDNDDYVGAGLPYYLAKCGIRALGRALGVELKKNGCVGLAVTPGFLRSESMLDIFEVTEATWRDAVGKLAPVDFKISETPYLLARGVAALAQDTDVARFAGQTLASWTLMKEYGYTDIDGDRPDFGRWLTEVRNTGKDSATTPPDDYR